MKRITYLLAFLFLASSVCSFAQAITNEPAHVFNQNYNFDVTNPPSALPSITDSKSGDKPLETTDRVNITFCQSSKYFLLYSDARPITYDPASDLLFITANETFYDDNGLIKMTGNLFYNTYENTNPNWTNVVFFDEVGLGFAQPSPVVHNPNDAMTFQDLNITILGRYFLDEGLPSWYIKGLAYGIKAAGGNFGVDINEFPNDNENYSWNEMSLCGNGKNATAFGAGRIKSENPNYQEGAYGLFTFQNDDAKQSVLLNSMPDAWSTNYFKLGALDETYNADVETTMDNDGNMYVAFMNFFGEDASRTLAVSKSADGGETWSDFNKMDNSVIEAYRSANNVTGTKYFPYEVYNAKNGFIAFDEDVYSYIYVIIFYNEVGSDMQDIELHLVEAKYDGVNWTIYKIHEMNGFSPKTFSFSTKYFDDESLSDDEKNSGILYWSNSALGYEIQAAKTQDSKLLIVKFLDKSFADVFETPILTTTYDINTQSEVDFQMDSMDVYGVNIAYREMTGTSWSSKQVTDETDSTNYMATWIPEILKDKNSVPFVYAGSGWWPADTIPGTTYYNFNILPSSMKDHFTRSGTAVNFKRILNPVGPVGVDEEEDYEFSVFDVYPNPVTGFAEFKFELETPSYVRLELYNSMGQLVRVLHDGQMSYGLQQVRTNLGDLTSGVYYYSLTAGNQKSTKVLNIVK